MVFRVIIIDFHNAFSDRRFVRNVIRLTVYPNEEFVIFAGQNIDMECMIWLLHLVGIKFVVIISLKIKAKAKVVDYICFTINVVLFKLFIQFHFEKSLGCLLSLDCEFLRDSDVLVWGNPIPANL